MDLREAIRHRNLGYENYRVHAKFLLTLPQYQGHDDSPSLAAVEARERLAMSGPLYHSSSEIETLLRAAGSTLPETTLAQELLPTSSGVWIFTDEWLDCGAVRGDRLAAASGLSWFADSTHMYIDQLINTATGFMGLGKLVWKFGETVDAAAHFRHTIPTENVLQRRYDTLRFLLSAFLFVKQRLVEFDMHRPDRAMRKWGDKIGLPESDVRIVQLRRKDYSHDEGEHKAVDWSCHWLVHGHWRAQYHPSTATHEPLYILPFVKGDMDKPFKKPAARMFVVKR